MVDAWMRFTATGDAQAEKNIIQQTKTGRPAGDEAFVQSLETLVGRELHLKNTGRPRLKLNRDYVPGITC